MVVVPRHPQRFDEVAQLLQNSGKNVVRKSTWADMSQSEQREALQQADMVLGDTMGEMFAYYAIADVVLMGGTWLPYGGQNFLEPMALGKPVIVGESIYNFEQIGLDALEKGVLWQAPNILEALLLIDETILFNDGCNQSIFIKKIGRFVQSECGAVERLIRVLL